MPTPTLAADNAQNNTQRQSDLKRLRDRIETLQQKLDASEGAHKEAADDLRASERAISEANRKLRDLNAQQREVNAQLAKLQTQSRHTSADIEAQQAQLARVLYAQYTGAQPDALGDALRLLMSGADPEHITRDMTYLGYIARAHADLIRDLRNNLTHLGALAQDARAQHDQLAAIQQEQQAQRGQLEKEQRARQQVLARTSKEIKQQRHEISTLKRNEERLSKLIKQIDEALKNERLPAAGNDNSPFAQLKGKLSLPVRGELRNRFGSPRESGMLWKGLFIAASSGQDVHSIAAGRVVFADWLRGFGNLLIIDHGNGYMSLYGNNETLDKQVGDTVSAGDVIAQVGNSGGNGDSGLYFEMRYRGQAFDPLEWVKLK